MNVEIGAEAVQFPEKEYINGIAIAVHDTHPYVPYCEKLGLFMEDDCSYFSLSFILSCSCIGNCSLQYCTRPQESNYS